MVEINATVNEVSIRNWNVNTGEYKARKCKVKTPEKFAKCDVIMVTFDSEEDGKFESVVKNGECDLPCFSVPGNVLVGVYAYTEIDGKLDVRYSPTPVTMPVKIGSYINGQEPPTPTPGTYADLLEKIEDIENTGGGGSGDGSGVNIVDLDPNGEFKDNEIYNANTNNLVLNELHSLILEKQDDNLVQEVNENSANGAYPSAKAVYKYGRSILREHKDLMAVSVFDDPDMYPSNQAVFKALVKKQGVLESGTNIKTINGQSILGEGNLVIEGGSSSGEEWEPILACVGNVNAPTLVNLGGFEGASVGGVNKSLARLTTAGTTSIIINLGTTYKKLFVRIGNNSSSDIACSKGNIQLCWDSANSGWHNFSALGGGSTPWANLIWNIEFRKNHIFTHTDNTHQTILRTYASHVFNGTNKLTLKTVSSDATFNDINIEIWGVRL